MNKNKKLDEYGFAHLSLVIIIILSVAVVGLAGYRVNEARNASRAKSSEVTNEQKSVVDDSAEKQNELAEESLPEEQSNQPVEQKPQEESQGSTSTAPVSTAPHQIYFVKGGQSASGDTVDITHVMTEAHSGTCKFTFSLNGTIRVEKIVQISNTKACSVSIPKSEFPKSAEYSEVTNFTSDDGSVFAETQPYGILVM